MATMPWPMSDSAIFSETLNKLMHSVSIIADSCTKSYDLYHARFITTFSIAPPQPTIEVVQEKIPTIPAPEVS